MMTKCNCREFSEAFTLILGKKENKMRLKKETMKKETLKKEIP